MCQEPVTSKNCLGSKERQKHGFPCSAETDLFDAAILAHPEKIIVKRLLKSECLAGREPY